MTEAVHNNRPLSHSPPIQTEVVCSPFITSFPYLTTCRCEDCQAEALKKEKEQSDDLFPERVVGCWRVYVDRKQDQTANRDNSDVDVSDGRRNKDAAYGVSFEGEFLKGKSFVVEIYRSICDEVRKLSVYVDHCRQISSHSIYCYL